MHAESNELEAIELESLGHPVQALEPEAAEYVPIPQFVHVAVPGVPLNFPAAQSVHVPPLAPDEPALQVQAVSNELEAGEYELLGHATHTLDTVAPAVTEYVPAVQFVHTVAPVVAEYVPVIQFVHTVSTVAPVTTEYLPEPQVVQLPASVPEYVPATQVAQSPQPAPEYVPASQLAQLLEPAPEYVPAPQLVQLIAVPTAYVPAPQLAHAPQPSPEEYVPGGQE
jgi:hypothetical protein